MVREKSGFSRRNFLKGTGAAVIVGQASWPEPLFAALNPAAAVAFDSRSLIFHGKRKLLISGEIQYARSPRALWPSLLDRSKALDINGIASYVFWNVHEPERDVYDFSGERDLGHFLSLCEERELFVFLRSGPYAPNPHPVTAQIVSPEGKTILDSQELYFQLQASWNAPEWTAVEEAGPLNWQVWPEPLPAGRIHDATLALQPIEQLLLTRDLTDYCWYSTTIDIAKMGMHELVIPYGADFFYVYLDGKLAAQTVAPLPERRGPITPEDPAHPRTVFAFNSNRPSRIDGYRHVFSLPEMAAGRHRLDILSTALGMIKGDWMVDSPMNFERKGIWEGALFDGTLLNDWEMRPFLAGEKLHLVENNSAFSWSSHAAAQALCWYKAVLHLSQEMLAEDADYRLNAIGLGKGMLFVNGFAVGRHWLIVSPGTGGQPTQQYYHVPRNWLRAENTLIVFEEQKAILNGVRIERRRADR